MVDKQLEQRRLLVPRRSKRLKTTEHGEHSVGLVKPGKGPGKRSSSTTSLSDNGSSDDSDSDFARPNQKRKKKTARLRRKPSDGTDDDAGENPTISADNATHRLAHKRTRSATEKDNQPSQSDKKILPWASLPYQIILQIFFFASSPLHNELFEPTPNLRWLLAAARTCRSFAEPALTVLYRCPPLLGADKAYRLVELLENPSESWMFNYNVKIKRLEFDMVKVLKYVVPGRGLFNIEALLQHLTHVDEVEIFNSSDRPGGRRTGMTVRWDYPANLFSSLNTMGFRLKTWRWDGDMQYRTRSPPSLIHVHKLPLFQGLETVTFSNYNDGVSMPGTPANEKVRFRANLAESLSILPRLVDLKFEASVAISDVFLSLLQIRLAHLTIINCAHVTSKGLRAFLNTSGNFLKTLVLDRNVSLDIRFLPDLKHSCPRLERIKMDLNYNDTYSTRPMAEPRYGVLHTAGDTPTWPSSLQVIELILHRKWDSDTAEMFLNSLIKSADQLPDLRKLVLKIIIDMSWRDRARLRDQWINRLRRVFLKTPLGPNPHLSSFTAFNEWKKARMLQERQELNGHNTVTESLVGMISTDRHLSHEVETSAQDSACTRQLRPRKNDRPAQSSSTDSESGLEGNSDMKPAENDYVQGKCGIVDIRIDNLRPVENQFNENDFLDDEMSEDEEWIGSNGEGEDDAYAW